MENNERLCVTLQDEERESMYFSPGWRVKDDASRSPEKKNRKRRKADIGKKEKKRRWKEEEEGNEEEAQQELNEVVVVVNEKEEENVFYTLSKRHGLVSTTFLTKV